MLLKIFVYIAMALARLACWIGGWARPQRVGLAAAAVAAPVSCAHQRRVVRRGHLQKNAWMMIEHLYPLMGRISWSTVPNQGVGWLRKRVLKEVTLLLLD